MNQVRKIRNSQSQKLRIIPLPIFDIILKIINKNNSIGRIDTFLVDKSIKFF